jgi:hypothetical protein
MTHSPDVVVIPLLDSSSKEEDGSSDRQTTQIANRKQMAIERCNQFLFHPDSGAACQYPNPSLIYVSNCSLAPPIAC